MNKLTTKIFIDGGSPEETNTANEKFQAHFGYPLDGQTTNPSLIAKNLQARMVQEGKKLTPELAIEEYKKIVTEISNLLPHGSVSIQVLANETTSAEEMISQARERITWIPNGSVKIPCTTEGLKAAEQVCKEMPINITLVFSQSQAAAVYEATRGAKHPVFLSPFVGRLDDLGQAGMDTVTNMLTLYKQGDGHVEVLAASIRSLDHILCTLHLTSPIMTLPSKAFTSWEESDFMLPDKSFVYERGNLTPIPYDEAIILGKPWSDYNLAHELTSKGLATFWKDWQDLFI